VTKDELASLLGEGFHTAFRKAADSSEAVAIHKQISALPDVEWARIVEFVAHGLIVSGLEVDTPAPEGVDETNSIMNAQTGIEGHLDYDRRWGGSWTLLCSECGRIQRRGGTAEDHDVLVCLWSRHEEERHGGNGLVYASMLIVKPVKL
jgi:hypothetical protein